MTLYVICELLFTCCYVFWCLLLPTIHYYCYSYSLAILYIYIIYYLARLKYAVSRPMLGHLAVVGGLNPTPLSLFGMAGWENQEPSYLYYFVSLSFKDRLTYAICRRCYVIFCFSLLSRLCLSLLLWISVALDYNSFYSTLFLTYICFLAPIMRMYV